MTAAEMLTRIESAAGPDVLDEMMGIWLAQRHRKRPRLQWARPDRPARAKHYLAFVRGLPCFLCGAPPPNDPHHFGPRGVGQKADDYRALPLCRKCHDTEHNRSVKLPRPMLVGIIDTLVLYLRIVEQR